jgi:DNA-binding transcriptional LysR family regulator
MNLKFLETFVWVARLKSFRLTAEKLFTTQASMSSRIAVLEATWGEAVSARLTRRQPDARRLQGARLRRADARHRQALKQSLDSDRARPGGFASA